MYEGGSIKDRRKDEIQRGRKKGGQEKEQRKEWRKEERKGAWKFV